MPLNHVVIARNESALPNKGNLLATTHFDLGRGTVIQITRLGPMAGGRHGEGFLPVSFDWIARGRISRYQVRKLMGRWVRNAMWEGIVRDHGKTDEPVSASHDALVCRGRRWNHKHIKMLPVKVQED